MNRKIRALVDGYDEFIGIDHHKRTSYLTIKNRQGEIVKRSNIPTGRESLRRFLGGAGARGLRRIAVMEAGRAYRPMYRWLREEVDEVVVANPFQLKVICETAYKDDPIDSEKLTDLLMLGMVPQAYACSDEAWDRRQWLRQRMQLVGMQTMVKNRIHTLVDLHPDAEPARPQGTDLFGSQGQEWLETVRLPKPDRSRLDRWLSTWDFLRDQIAASNRGVRQIVKSEPRCQWVKTIPGIGDFFAALIVSEVDDIRRFARSKSFVSYIGLVPRRDDSGDRQRSGGMSKRGNTYLRWAFVEAAVPATRSNLALKLLYDRVRRRKGPKGGYNVAKVAVARKLAEIAFCVLRDERPYEDR